MSVLVAKNLAKRYGAHQVVSNVSLTVKSGEVVGLLGPNGAGKTTSFYMIVGLVPLDGGTVSLGDYDLSGLPMHVRARRGVGYLPRALASNPSFILLDEPFAGVDPISVLGIQRIIRYLSEREIGVLITDHQVREALNICDRAYIVSEGQMICAGKPDFILNDQRVREVYLGEEFRL